MVLASPDIDVDVFKSQMRRYGKPEEIAAVAAFLAGDEIQLCADPDRGHVFTDRLLHARGLEETMLLGADTARTLIRRLVPEAAFIAARIVGDSVSAYVRGALLNVGRRAGVAHGQAVVTGEGLAGRIADYKSPRRLRFLPALPRNPGGKVLRDEVRRLLNDT